MKKKVFLSFGGPSYYYNALERIRKEAENLHFFDKIICNKETDLDPLFLDKYLTFMQKNRFGFGYYIWKYQNVLQTLETLDDGDLLLYADAGCELNPQGLPRLHDYFELVKNDKQGLVVFELKDEHYEHYEYKWTKGEIFDFYNVRNKKEITDTIQILATCFFVRKSPTTIHFFKSLMADICNNIKLITNETSRTPNLLGFKDARNDQSMFSINCKIMECTTLPDETYPINQMDKPIWASRRRGF